MAGPFEMIAGHEERETVRDKQRCYDFKRRPRFRKVSNSAVNTAAAELNRSCFQQSATWSDPVFVHVRLYEAEWAL